MPISVVISDPDLPSGRVLARQLEDEAEDVAVLAVVDSPAATEALSAAVLPDVVLLTTGAADVTPLVRSIRSSGPSVRVLLLSNAPSAATDRLAHRAIRAGAAAVAPRWATARAHIAAVRAVATDRAALAPSVALAATQELEAFQPGLLRPLEDRILGGVAAGMSVDAVAAELAIPVDDVWRRLRDVRAKLEIADRVTTAARKGRSRRAEPTRFGPRFVLLTEARGALAGRVNARGAREPEHRDGDTPG